MNHDTPAYTHLFPGSAKMAFFNHAGVAPLCEPAAAALRQFVEEMTTRAPYLEVPFPKRIEEARAAAARLLHARGPHEIAFIPNTSTGLACVARGLDFQPGDSIVITDVEFPANRYPWEDVARRSNGGVELIEVKQLPDGRIDPEDVCDAIRDNTRVVSLSHVQYASGHRIDLKEISDTIHKVGGYLCVDAIQSVGAMPVDVQALGIDFLAADGHKWLLGPEGCGILYCHEDLAPLLHPPVVGWLNMVDPLDFGNYRYELQPDARRFEPGTTNTPGILALGAAIQMLLDVGLPEVWRRIEALTDHLCRRLPDKGYTVFSPRKTASEKSGIVIFSPPAGQDPARIASQLQQQNIHLVVREGRLRASPHFYNTIEQIDALVDALP